MVQGFIDMQEVSSPEQNDPNEQADNGRDIHYYPIPAGTKHRIHKHLQTDFSCVLCK